MNKRWLWLCCVLTVLILLAGWSLYSIPPSVDAQEEEYEVFLPIIMLSARPLSAAYGVSYIVESDLPEVVALNVRLVTWQTAASPQAALDLLEIAESYGLRVILRITNTGDWGWNGSSFDLSPLASFEPVIGGHPALFAVYGLHEPWERFTVSQLRQFYYRWQGVAPSLPMWHDLGHVPPTFTDGICDVCAIAANPHAWDEEDRPVNDYEKIRAKIWEAQTYIQADPDAILCVSPQAYGQNPNAPGPPVRMPTADEMRENASIVFGEFQVTCGLWYPYNHDSYAYVLSDPQFGEQRQVVAETYNLYFAP